MTRHEHSVRTRIIAVDSPTKTLREVADEVGCNPNYVYQVRTKLASLSGRLQSEIKADKVVTAMLQPATLPYVDPHEYLQRQGIHSACAELLERLRRFHPIDRHPARPPVDLKSPDAAPPPSDSVTDEKGKPHVEPVPDQSV